MPDMERNNVRAITRLNNALVKSRNKKLADWDLTSIQADVLLFILRNISKGEISQLDVQTNFKLTNPTVSGIVDRLEEKGFLRRMCSTRDARFRNLVPLPKANDLREVLRDNRFNFEEKITEGMTAEQSSLFSDLLLVALANVEE